MKVLIRYHKKASDTAKVLRDTLLSGEYNVDVVDLVNKDQELPRTVLGRLKIYDYTINYGFCEATNTFANALKKTQAEIIASNGILPNTLMSESEIEDLIESKWWTNVVLKNNTRITLIKNVKEKDLQYGVYKYIPNKSEWRINYSFGKVNNIFKKKLNNFPLGNAASLTPELDEELRRRLTEYTKQIASVAGVQNFGLDILRDDTTNTFYFLELNKANSLTPNTAPFFLKGYFRSLEE